MRQAMFASLAVALLATPLVWSDIAPRPGPRPQPPAGQAKVKVNIVVDDKATEPRLIIPLQLIAGGFGGGFGAGAAPGVDAPPGAGPKSEPKSAPPKDEEDAADPQTSSLRFSTLIIGLALTLSLSTGGLWLVRRRSGKGGGGLALLVILALSALTIGAAAVHANRPAPPQRPQPKTDLPGPLPALLRLEGVRVDIDPQGDAVRVILTKKLQDITQKAVPGK